jgi:hypothetical protein
VNPDMENISSYVRIQNTKTNEVRELGKGKVDLKKDERFVIYF